MKAYFIFQETVTDEALFADYRKDVPATLAPFGGEFVVRGGAFNVVEGEWHHPRCVIIGFPCRKDAEGWYASAAYQAILPKRLQSSHGNAIIVDGVA